ncbi:MAG: hypothetical protein BroJett040_23740 [Oligoflexia bacterium]|nr:MAG: hypothetical protein BroJett040_23740 [Oligoflexia bacterium]
METLSVESFKAKVFDYETKKTWDYQGDVPAIVDFYADWCGPCRMLSPVLEELSKEYKGKLHIYKVNTEKTPELAELFGVRSIPSLLFVPLKGEPAMAAGFAPKEQLQKAILEVLNVSVP